MPVRKAIPADAPGISRLLHQLGYPDTGHVVTHTERLLNHPDAELWVYEEAGNLLALISLHFIPQIAVAGDFARISYFVVAAGARNKGIGQLLEAHCIALAKKRGCDRMEVHCHARRTDAHRFYEKQGYSESPKYFVKSLVEMPTPVAW